MNNSLFVKVVRPSSQGMTCSNFAPDWSDVFTRFAFRLLFAAEFKCFFNFECI